MSDQSKFSLIFKKKIYNKLIIEITDPFKRAAYMQRASWNLAK